MRREQRYHMMDKEIPHEFFLDEDLNRLISAMVPIVVLLDYFLIALRKSVNF